MMGLYCFKYSQLLFTPTLQIINKFSLQFVNNKINITNIMNLDHFFLIVIFCRPELLLESLVNPIPRAVYDNVIFHTDVDSLLEVLKERELVRECVSTGRVPSSDYYRETQHNMKNVSEHILFNY